MQDHMLGEIVAATIEQGLLSDEYPIIGAIDVDYVKRRIDELHAAFPDTCRVQHCFAVKACSFEPVIELFAQNGMGAEVASPGELRLALSVGVPAASIVLDSPVKTRSEIEAALDCGVSLNIDNFDELDEVDALLTDRHPAAPIGLRINPQTGSGSVESVSTASATSKFGIPLHHPDNTRRIVEAYKRHPWLTQIHVHTGSLGCPLELIAESIAVIHDLAEQINDEIGSEQITRLDIGGGLPVPLSPHDKPPQFTDYVEALRARTPSIFDGRFEFVTEFGRAFVAEAGVMLTRAQYTKEAGSRRIVLTYAGAQVASRTVYDPDSWPIHISVHSPEGLAKSGVELPHDIAGPCCFSGDLVAENRMLPKVETGDLVVLHNVGAYYLSSHYSYNELPPIGVFGLRRHGTGLTIETIRPVPDT